MVRDAHSGNRSHVGGLYQRSRYVAQRFAALKLSNLFGPARDMAKRTWKPRILIAADMIWCSLRYETGFADYYDWDFYLLKASERKTFMTHPKSNHLAQKLNQPSHRTIFSDKVKFNARFNDFLGREWLDVRQSTTAELRDFLTKHKRVIVKVTDSIGGIGIEKREASDTKDFEKLRAELRESRQFLVEEFLPQHETMSELCPTSINTLRLVTYFDGEQVHILARVLKMGNGGDVDNFSRGGMYTMLDDDGVGLYPAFTGSGGIFDVHPLTGVSIVGFQVPLYRDVLALVDELARIVPQIPYVGWDIAIRPDRPVVIEGNYNTGVFQAKPSISGVRTGLLPHYKEHIGF